ncbi:MAG TPA: DUF4783 domain-containing protein [Cyclobacteriaceae bacterium]|jgi:hypothetical protein
MKKEPLYRLFFLVIFFVFGFVGKAQEDIIHSVESAMKLGSSKELARYLNQTVEINLEGEISSYSKMQAEFVLKDFFKKNPPEGFEIIHNGTSKGGLKYAIGKYSCKRGYFRVWMRVKEFSGKLLVYEMNFFKED